MRWTTCGSTSKHYTTSRLPLPIFRSRLYVIQGSSSPRSATSSTLNSCLGVRAVWWDLVVFIDAGKQVPVVHRNAILKALPPFFWLGRV